MNTSPPSWLARVRGLSAEDSSLFSLAVLTVEVETHAKPYVCQSFLKSPVWLPVTAYSPLSSFRTGRFGTVCLSGRRLSVGKKRHWTEDICLTFWSTKLRV